MERIHQNPEPELSLVSMKRARSKGATTLFQRQQPSAEEKIIQNPGPGPQPGPQPEPGPGPEPSCVSMKSDDSKDAVINFKRQQPSVGQKIHQTLKHGPGTGPGPGPAPSCVSFKSNDSKNILITFEGEQPSAAKRRKLEKQDSSEPELDSVSMKTGYTRKHPYNFMKRHRPVDQRVEQQNSEVPRAQSVQQHLLDSIFMVRTWTTSCSPSVVFRHLHAALCRPVDCQCVQHGSDVWLRLWLLLLFSTFNLSFAN